MKLPALSPAVAGIIGYGSACVTIALADSIVDDRRDSIKLYFLGLVDFGTFPLSYQTEAG